MRRATKAKKDESHDGKLMVEDQQSCCRKKKKKKLQCCKARKTKQTAKFKSKNQMKQWKGGKRKKKIIIYKQTNQVFQVSLKSD